MLKERPDFRLSFLAYASAPERSLLRDLPACTSAPDRSLLRDLFESFSEANTSAEDLPRLRDLLAALAANASLPERSFLKEFLASVSICVAYWFDFDASLPTERLLENPPDPLLLFCEVVLLMLLRCLAQSLALEDSIDFDRFRPEIGAFSFATACSFARDVSSDLLRLRVMWLLPPWLLHPNRTSSTLLINLPPIPFGLVLLVPEAA
mmetsp:Transcript_21911/g.46222  ORF Transcript_21911/g.46222 Transcript_21911/m.46222 type:complete len:208 (-) Transcript_21911:827-1450(-)